MDYLDLIDGYETHMNYSKGVRITTSTTTIFDKRKVMSNKIKKIFNL